MQRKNDTSGLTRDNLSAERFSQIVLDEDIWIHKEYCQWKMELLWWLVKQGNVSAVREDQLVLMLNRFSDENIPAYFSIILEMIVFYFKDLPRKTTELAISVINNKPIGIDSNEHDRLVNEIEELPSPFNGTINKLIGNAQIYTPSIAIRSHAESIGSLITPDNITILTALVSSAIGVTTVAIKGIKLWLDERASRKIRIKYKDFEVELQGSISEKEMRERLSMVKEIKGELDKSDMLIILPNDKQAN
jgi:hypothetical protein